MKTFYVITEETYPDSYHPETNVLYVFDDLEEADKVLTLLDMENMDGNTYVLHTVDNDHPFPGTLEEETLKFNTKQNAKELEKRERQQQKERDIQKNKQEERDEQCRVYKLEIDAFAEWLYQPRHFISVKDVMQEKVHEEESKEVFLQEHFLMEASEKRLSLKPAFQSYLLDHPDEKVLELLEKPLEELLHLSKPDKGRTTQNMYIPKRLRELMIVGGVSKV